MTSHDTTLNWDLTDYMQDKCRCAEDFMRSDKVLSHADISYTELLDTTQHFVRAIDALDPTLRTRDKEWSDMASDVRSDRSSHSKGIAKDDTKNRTAASTRLRTIQTMFQMQKSIARGRLTGATEQP